MAGVRRSRKHGKEFLPLPMAPAVPRPLDDIDRRILDALQDRFPLCERPFLAVATNLGLDEANLIKRIERMFAAGVLTRIGPLFNTDRMGGTTVLAAMVLPPCDFDRVAAFVNAQPEITRNYRREHPFNLWFVGAAETPKKVESTFRYMESVSGYPIYRFPKEREFSIERKLNV